LFNSAFESFSWSCFEKLGVDQLVVMGVGGGVRARSIGSDSPSKTAALVSWSNDADSGSRLILGRIIGASGTMGQGEGELSQDLTGSARGACSRSFTAEPVLPDMASPELRLEPIDKFSIGFPVLEGIEMHTLAVPKHGEDLDASTA
jgi:hypothetical protein